MLAEHVFERAVDLAERGVRPHAVHHRGHEVRRPVRLIGQPAQGGCRRAAVAVGADARELLHLGLGDGGIERVQLHVAIGLGGRVADVAIHRDLADFTRRERDGRAVTTALRRLGDEARGTANLMPAIMECVTAYATLGEINRALKDVFGEHKEPVKF